MSEYLDYVRKWWDQTDDSERYRQRRMQEVIAGVLKDPRSVLHPAVFALLQELMGGIAGKRVLVPSSGDNYAVFALARLGAQVVSAQTSVRASWKMRRPLQMRTGWMCSSFWQTR